MIILFQDFASIMGQPDKFSAEYLVNYANKLANERNFDACRVRSLAVTTYLRARYKDYRWIKPFIAFALGDRLDPARNNTAALADYDRTYTPMQDAVNPHYELVLPVIERQHETNKTTWTASQLGKLYALMGKGNEAQRLFEEAVELDTQNKNAWARRELAKINGTNNQDGCVIL